MSVPAHLPVMLDQVIELLAPKPGGTYVDLTVGAGGHARAILERSAPDGRLLAVDRDPAAIALARAELDCFADRLRLEQGQFSDLRAHLDAVAWSEVDGLLADLGVSSMQLDEPERGFSFQQAGPLDMRMDPQRGRPLSAWLAELSLDELADALRRYGEVPQPRRVARRILDAHGRGELNDTLDLARAVGRAGRSGRRHPATLVFQALRIMVNQELGELEQLLDMLPEPLRPGGRAVFISFHSLEDRAIKRRFRALEGECTCPPGLPVCGCGRQFVMKSLARKARKPTAGEQDRNPRARSARLRAAERVAA